MTWEKRTRAGTAVADWMPRTGRGRAVEVVSLSAASAEAYVVSCPASSLSVLAGDLIVVAGYWENGGGGVADRLYSVSASGVAGITFTNAQYLTGADYTGIGLWWAAVPTAGTITVTGSVNSSKGYTTHGIHVLILRGANTTTPMDVTPTSGSLASSTTPTVPAITPASANALPIAFIGTITNTDAITGPSGWTTNNQIGGGQHSRALAYRTPWPLPITTGDAAFSTGTAQAHLYIRAAIRPAA